MKCRAIVRELPAYTAGELPERRRARVEAHLKHCVLCSAELRALKRTDQLLDTLGAVEPRRDLVGLVMRRIEHDQATQPAFKRFLSSLQKQWPAMQRAAIGFTAVVLIAIGLVGLYQVHQARRNMAMLPPRPNGPTARSGGNWLSEIFRKSTVGTQEQSEAVQAIPTGFAVRLTDNDLEKLNADMEAARRALAKIRGESVDEWTAEDPSLLLSPGEGGTLIIKTKAPGSE